MVVTALGAKCSQEPQGPGCGAWGALEAGAGVAGLRQAAPLRCHRAMSNHPPRPGPAGGSSARHVCINVIYGGLVSTWPVPSWGAVNYICAVLRGCLPFWNLF